MVQVQEEEQYRMRGLQDAGLFYFWAAHRIKQNTNTLFIMKYRLFLLTIILFTITSACDVAKQVGGAYNMINCKYAYNSISSLTFGGMNLSKGVSLTHIPQITSMLSGRANSIPVGFTLNLDVTNPNQSAALLNGIQYILTIDNIDFTTGNLNRSLNIPAGGKDVLPLQIQFDLAKLLTGDSKNSVVNIAKNFIGIGDKASNVSLQIKPTFLIGNQAITSPVYIPVNFSFGGM